MASDSLPIGTPSILLDPSTGLEFQNPTTAQFYNEIMAIWPDLYNKRAIIAPAGNGVDRFTGRFLGGWKHVEQSMSVIFATPFHERVLRRWVGSFVPILLGESTVPRIITRFFWAISTSLDLWEPRYRIKQVFYMGSALSDYKPQITSLAAADLVRLGEAIFRTEGQYYPRATVGDFTPYERKLSAISGRGGQFWDVRPLGVSV
jgi:phage baseplate assembly protein W